MATTTVTDRPSPLVLDKRLPMLTTPSASNRLTLLVYGASGVGKTVLCGSAAADPRLAPVLFCDTEGGLMSIAHIEVPVLPLNTSDDFNGLVSYLEEATQAGDLPYKTIVLDSITRACAFAMQGILRRYTNSQRKVSDVEEGSDWGIFNHRMSEFLRRITDKAYGLNVIVTATEREMVDGKIWPNLLGKQVPNDAPQYFDIVARYVTEDVARADGKGVTQKRRLILASQARSVAKDRSNPFGLLPPVMDDPTIPRLLDRIAEGRAQALAAQRRS